MKPINFSNPSKYTYLIIGASNNPEKYGFRIYKYLKDKDLKVYPINHKEKLIQGDKSFQSIKDFLNKNENIDNKDIILNFVVPPQVGLKTTKNAIEKGFKNFWYQPGAFSEEINQYLDNKHEIKVFHDVCVMTMTD